MPFLIEIFKGSWKLEKYELENDILKLDKFVAHGTPQVK